MPSYSDIKEAYHDASKNKYLVIIIFALGALMVAISFIAVMNYYIGSKQGKHVKILYGLFEENIPESKHDTIYKQVYIKQNTLSRPIIRGTKNQTIIKGTNNHSINGDKNVVGVNGDLYSGVKQRYISEKLIYRLSTDLPESREALIDINNPEDQESHAFAQQIYSFIKKLGYRNVSQSVSPPSFPFDTVEIIKSNVQVSIIIHQASNSK